MTLLDDELAEAAPMGDTYLSIGVFDGVHLGHRHLLDLLKQEAARAACLTGVITFANNPRAVLSHGVVIQSLTSVEERIHLLHELGIETVAPVTFDLEVSRVTATEFVTLLQRHMRMRGLVVGPDFVFGHNREGTPEFLRALGKEKGFSVTVAGVYQEGDVGVSSTAIRTALAQGDVATTSLMLGRRYTLTGEVVHGTGRGTSVLGYPTANIAVGSNRAIPGDGIYATWVQVDHRWYQAATSIGTRPTFGVGERTIEAFVLDFAGDLYQKNIPLEFVERIRDEAAFESTEALRSQIDADVEQTRRILDSLT